MSGSELTAANNGRSRQVGRWALRAVLVLFCLYIVGEIWVNDAKRQWDFRCYYFAGAVDSEGGNPYDTKELNRRAHHINVLPFVYPPITLPAFRLLASLEFETAYVVWLVFKIILTGVLIFLWRFFLFRDLSGDLFAWFVLLGLGAAVYIDLVTGNITVIEQVLLWGGLIALLRNRLIIFCAAVVAASLFKFTPLLFLLLLPLTGQRRWWVYAVGSIAAFFVLTGASYLLDPAAWQAFLSNAQLADEPGELGNPSTLAMARDAVVFISQKTGLALGDAVAYVLYAIIVAVTVILSAGQFRALYRSRRPDRLLVTIYLACVVYALIMPRFKTYSFILLVPPALYALLQSADRRAFWPLFALLVLTVATPFPINPFIQVFWRYYPILLVFLIWGLLLKQVADESGHSEPSLDEI